MRASAAQRGLWFAQSVLPTSPVFTVGQLFRFDIDPDPARLLAAARRVAGEADGLRSRFRADTDGDVTVEIGEAIPVTRVDLPDEGVPDGSASDDDDAIDRYARAAVCTVIDPGAGPCASITVLTAGDHTALLLIAHHIVLDAYGLGLIGRRIAAVYADPDDARALRSISTLPADFDVAPDSDRDFWSSELSGVTAPLTLSGCPRTHRLAADVHTVRTVVPDAGAITRSPARLTAAIAAFCAGEAETDDVVLGFPMMNRLGSPAANVPCSTVNVIPLRVEVRMSDTVDDVADRVSARLRAVAGHARYRGEDIVRDLRHVGVDGAIGPTVNIKPFGSTIAFGTSTARVMSLARGPVVDMSVTALDLGVPDPGDLELVLDADTALYDRDRVEEIARGIGGMIATAMSDNGPPIAAALVAADDHHARRIAIRAADDRARVPVNPVPVVDRILGQPDHLPAVACGDERLTFGDLRRRVDLLSAQLGPCDAEDVVAVALPRGVDLIAALLSVLRSGAAFLPLDPGFPDDRLRVTLDDARPVATIESGHDRPIVRRQRDSRGRRSGVGPVASAHSPAYVIYTSGSTGTPKGVVVGHAALRNFTDAMIRRIGLRPGRTMLAVTTISFDIAILETLVPLAAGSSVVLATPDEVHDPTALAALIGRHGVDLMQATPSLWTAVLDSGHGASLAGVDVLVGGEQLPPTVAESLVTYARSVRNMYGPTETTIWSTTAHVEAGAPIRIGTPIDNTGVRVLDAALYPVTQGRIGELYLTGDGLARGYHGMTTMTAQRFVADPFGGPGARMYRTGDLARAGDDGALECLGRIDHQVKVRGFRIELGDIENALAEHDSVARAVASTIDGRLIAHVVPTGETDVDVTVLRDHAASLLPDYMVPAAVLVVPGLPLTPNGKVDRRALPTPDFAAEAGQGRAPRSSAEHALAEAFATVLRLPRVGADENFFHLGGDSISAVRLVAGAARAGLVITVLDVFDGPTVAALATRARPLALTAAPTDDTGFSTSGTSDRMTTSGVGSDEMDELMDGNLL
ncbi:amino acid adenylation domain-containing protein [Gordonia sp. ABSL11-1]|uniref:amino acid adenylation domain-containing protein n=1 Tax=Gordonia sp. ABSL11-1 TaxID=3053924 RepID=UPI0025727720|nr:amino acid adenylation domain-containing protein [Gordonia sp. ABSL11-1]MDL9946106.1 amino acid adenylation domain-containing protein [Gordonia sp. ABSL11-1]